MVIQKHFIKFNFFIGASVEEIRSNYKHLARKWHPDKQDGTIGTEEATKVRQSNVFLWLFLSSDFMWFGCCCFRDGISLAKVFSLVAYLVPPRQIIFPVGCWCKGSWFDFHLR